MSDISRRNFMKSVVAGAAGLSLGEMAEANEILNQEEKIRIGFGSCLRNSSNAGILSRVVDAEPDLFVWLGDNIYGDTTNMDTLRRKYKRLSDNPNFQKLWNHCPNLSIWDDHDFGRNNAGREYPKKEESREIFLDFWQVPQSNARRQHTGIYGSYIYGTPGQEVQLILLDGRSFRSGKNKSSSDTILGDEQWEWLEAQLQVQSEVKIICSGIQVLPWEHGYEGWYEFPYERSKLFELINKHKVPGVIFVSGDQHWSELSRLDKALPYPAYEFTCSSLDQSWLMPRNSLRVGNGTGKANFGVIELNWSERTTIEFQTYDSSGRIKEVQKVYLNDLA